MEETNKQHKNSFDWLKQHQWQKGQSGNPAGRPKTKTLKEFAREFLSNMSDEARIEYFQNLTAETVWKMAEGNPTEEKTVKAQITISDVLDQLDDGLKTQGQTVESDAPVQDTEQSGAASPVPVQQDAVPLQPEPPQPEPNPQV